MAKGLSDRMLIEHMDAQGQGVFTSRSWRRIFEIRGTLVHELILEFFSTFREISSAGDFFGTTPPYTSNKDSMLRLCHRLIACSIVGRSQAPEMVTVIDLFYLRGMDVGSVIIPYLLARYLRFFTLGRKQGAMISRDFPEIGMAELVRLEICEELDDTWAWVAPRPERQQVTVAGAAEVAPVVDEGALAVPAHVYIDIRPNGDALRKCILEGPYQPTTVIIPAVPATTNSPVVLERTTVETILTMFLENKADYESEKKAIHLLLTRIGDEIYSTVDACKTAHEMWIDIERLQQGESPNIQNVKTNLFGNLDNSLLMMESP
uniref:Uncharacterized protein n=1 Tax=Tanacetum cinerariifolium TaxID=118510 RepID=A0A699GZJ0_TANCI|nr:hypothetical protein [Tanacetum cinerariifolium]